MVAKRKSKVAKLPQYDPYIQSIQVTVVTVTYQFVNAKSLNIYKISQKKNHKCESYNYFKRICPFFFLRGLPV